MIIDRILRCRGQSLLHDHGESPVVPGCTQTNADVRRSKRASPEAAIGETRLHIHAQEYQAAGFAVESVPTDNLLHVRPVSSIYISAPGSLHRCPVHRRDACCASRQPTSAVACTHSLQGPETPARHRRIEVDGQGTLMTTSGTRDPGS